MAKKQAHYRLDASLVEALEQRAKTENITITELVTRYLKQGLGLPAEKQGTINIEELEQKIAERVSIQLQKATQTDPELEKRIAERVTEVLVRDIEEKISAVEQRVTSDVYNRVSAVYNKAQEISGKPLIDGDGEEEKEDSQSAKLQTEIIEDPELSHKDLTKVRKSTSQLLKILQKEQPKGNWIPQKLRRYTLGDKGKEEHTVGKCQFKYAGERERTKDDKSGYWFDVVYPLR